MRPKRADFKNSERAAARGGGVGRKARDVFATVPSPGVSGMVAPRPDRDTAESRSLASPMRACVSCALAPFRVEACVRRPAACARRLCTSPVRRGTLAWACTPCASPRRPGRGAGTGRLAADRARLARPRSVAHRAKYARAGLSGRARTGLGQSPDTDKWYSTRPPC